jgi:cellulose synthase/poly-beta-1,6-N-acetylglucosamine synthase-like glycosyltransferase
MVAVNLIGWCVLALSGAYAFVSLVIWAATGRSARRHARRRSTSDGDVRTDARLPFVSVVVAARDEQAHLPACLESLKRLDYPESRWEVVLVDDRSTDATADLARAASDAWPSLRVINVSECPPGLAGKQHALAVGIEETTGELMAFTDADCVVPPGWLREIAHAMEPDVGVACGLASPASSTMTWWLSRIEKADLAHLSAVFWGLIELGTPFTAMGNNLAIRRAAYDRTGGYESLGSTIAEDCAMVQAIGRLMERWRVVSIGPDGAVGTRSSTGIGSFMRQRARWSTGVRRLRVYQFAFLLAVFAQRIATLVATALAAIGALDGWFAVVAWACWFAADAVLIDRVARALGIGGMVVWGPVVTLWQAAYQPIVGIWGLLFPGSVTWLSPNSAARETDSLVADDPMDTDDTGDDVVAG